MKTRSLTIPGRQLLWALLVLSAALTVRADEADPPGRAARLAIAEGSVSLQPAGVQDWANATVNRPLTTGDKLWTDQDSRAELDVGALVARLGPTTGFSFVNLDDNTAQMQLTAGTLIVRVRDLQGSYEVDTPNLALSLQQPGEYRVEVNDAGDTTTVKVSQGLAQASGGGQSVNISTQQLVTFTGTDTLAMQSGTLGAPDDLDGWSASRERALRDSPSRQYVAEDVAGTQDLDNNGTWQDTPDYGYVWTPTAVAVGWVPYRYGHWAWIGPWGWTWVDDAPWGYAPFHYGRWVSLQGSWCWVPGPRRVRPVYAPALVAWVGAPAAVGAVAVGANVGWFPLGPREVYVPAYRVSPTYVRQVNVTNTTIVNNTYITNVYENNVTNVRYVNNTSAAVTAVPQNVLSTGQRVNARTVTLSGDTLRQARVTAAAPAIVPARQSVLGPGGARPNARPPATLVNRPVVARTPPPRAAVPFDRQVSAMQENGGRPLARTDLARLQPEKPAVPVRMVSGSAPAVNASTLPRANRPASPGGAERPGGSASLGDRERVLQNNRAGPAPSRNDRPPESRPAQGSPGANLRPDRPVAPPTRTSNLPQNTYSTDGGRTYNSLPATPADRPPGAAPAEPYARPSPEAAPAERYRSPPPGAASSAPGERPSAAPAPVNRPPASARPAQPPGRAEPKNESRGENGSHSDRNSRDRTDR